MDPEDKKLIESLRSRIEEIIQDKEQAEQIVNHIRDQFRMRYRYLIGEWRSSRRVKRTTDGQFVTIDEVIEYLRE